jgi:hypothetical protein
MHFILFFDEKHKKLIRIVEIHAVNPVSAFKQRKVIFIDPQVDLFCRHEFLDPEITDLIPVIAVAFAHSLELDIFAADIHFFGICQSEKSIDDLICADQKYKDPQRVDAFYKLIDRIKCNRHDKIADVDDFKSIVLFSVDILFHDTSIKRRGCKAPAFILILIMPCFLF